MPWYTPINDELIASIEANDPGFYHLKLFMPGVAKETLFKFIDALERNTTLTDLSLNEVLEADEVIARFADYLKNNRSLKRLRLECRSSSRKLSWNIIPIINALKENHYLANLSLEFGYMSIANIIALAEMLPLNCGLHALYLQRNHIDALGAQAIVNALEHNYSLEALELAINPVMKRSDWLSFYGVKSSQSSEKFSKELFERVEHYQERNEYFVALEKAIGIIRAAPFEPEVLSSHLMRNMFDESRARKEILIALCVDYCKADETKKESLGLEIFFLLEMMLKDKGVDWKALPDAMQLKTLMQLLVKPIQIEEPVAAARAISNYKI